VGPLPTSGGSERKAASAADSRWSAGRCPHHSGGRSAVSCPTVLHAPAPQLPMPPDPCLLDAVGTVRDSPHRPAWDSLLLSSREWDVAAWGMCSLEARRLDVEQCGVHETKQPWEGVMLTRRAFTGVVSCAICAMAAEFRAGEAAAQATPPAATSGVTRKILSQTDGPARGWEAGRRQDQSSHHVCCPEGKAPSVSSLRLCGRAGSR
jgi:hypothetical protein